MLAAFETLDNCLLISYEELTETPYQTITRIMSFLNLPVENIGNLKEQVFSVHGLESGLVNMNGRSLELLTNEEIAIIDNITGELLTKFCYKIGSEL